MYQIITPSLFSWGFESAKGGQEVDGGDKEDAGQEPAGVPLQGRGEGDTHEDEDEGGQGAEAEARHQVQHPSVDIIPGSCDLISNIK